MLTKCLYLIITWCPSLVWGSPLDSEDERRCSSPSALCRCPWPGTSALPVSLRPPWQRWCHPGAASEIWRGAMSIYISFPPGEREATPRSILLLIEPQSQYQETLAPNWPPSLEQWELDFIELSLLLQSELLASCHLLLEQKSANFSFEGSDATLCRLWRPHSLS